MKYLSRLLVAAALFAMSSGTSTASSASQTFKIKTSGGSKANLALALNDATGDVLIAFESSGEILATLAKQGGSGRYKAKKAKRVSGGEGNNHRPSVAFDPSVNEFLAAWDTGPEDLQAASDGSDPGASAILSRRIKRKNGKRTKSIVATVSDGELNIGPNLGVRQGGVEVFYTSHERPSTRGLRNLLGTLFRNPVQQGVANASPEQIKRLREGLSWIVGLALHDEQACAVFTRYLLQNPLADFMFIGLVDGLAEYLESASNVSPALGAFMYYLDELDYKVQTWYEYGPPLRQRKLFMQFADLSGDTSHTEALGGYQASNFIGTAFANERASTDRGWVADVTPAGQIRALQIGGSAQIFQTVNLLKRTKDITDMALIMLPDDRTMLVWVESKNQKTQDIWVHIFDLP